MQEIYATGDINDSLKNIIALLSSMKLCTGDKFVVDASGRPAVHTKIQVLFNAKFNNELDRLLYEIVMTHLVAAEKLGSGGFNRSVEMLLEKFDHGLCGYQQLIDPIFRGSSCVATQKDVDSIVEKCSQSSVDRVQISEIVREALKLSGFSGKIIIEKTSSNVPSVELVRGYTFDLQQMFDIDVNIVKPRIACIDGYIESVSEIHHFLTSANEMKEPCIIFSRGMSDDVKHTLKVNYDRGSLRVVPIGVRFDLTGMNSLIDISITAGCDLVSSLKGDLISNVKFDELPCVDQVTTFKDHVVITNTSTRRRVKEHVVNLRQRRTDEQNEDKSKLFDLRIKSLIPSHVVIRLVDDKNFVANNQAIDYTLRSIKSIIDYGVLDNGRSMATEFAAHTHVNKCIKTLSNMGACVV